MKILGAASMSLALLCAGLAHADPSSLTVTRNGSYPSAKGPGEYFTGAVRVDRIFNATAPSRTSAGNVTFEPAARSAWHTHPLGQTLVVTSGLGLVQQWGAPVHEIRPGDVVWIPPGVKRNTGMAPRQPPR
jgi:quercetin dioxygenase-like cupin family protein